MRHLANVHQLDTKPDGKEIPPSLLHKGPDSDGASAEKQTVSSEGDFSNQGTGGSLTYIECIVGNGNQKEIERHVCAICNKIFDAKHKLNRHTRSHGDKTHMDVKPSE